MGALIEGESLSPKKKKEILIVIPNKEKRITFAKSSFLIQRWEVAKGKRRSEAPKKRRKARVKGGIFCKASLKIGAAAPQMMLATISARIAFWWIVKVITLLLTRFIK